MVPSISHFRLSASRTPYLGPTVSGPWIPGGNKVVIETDNNFIRAW